MDVFWEQGYEAASLSMLLAAMGIAKGSLYKVFPDKHAVYLATLDRYDRGHIRPGIMMLRDGTQGSGGQRLRAALLAPADAIHNGGQRRGCFLCNAAIDMAPKDAAVAEIVRSMMDRLEAGFQSAFDDSGATAGLTASQCRAAGRMLVTTYMGLHVMAKAGYSSRRLTAIAQSALSTLGL